jgi:uncharacterized protein (DUF1684 family)
VTAGTVDRAGDLAGSWAAWHAEREDILRAPHGWLSLAGLHWLDGEARPYPELPGTWRAVDGGVEVTAARGDEVVVDGTPVDGTVRVEPVDGKPGVLVEVGERRVEVIRREEHHALRVRDPQAPTRQRFAGVPAFPVDAAVRFTLGGAEQELVALAGEAGELRLHFRDGTSGQSTYGGGRVVRTDPPGADGTVRIDLNRALNLPCAFTAYATCPLPPAGNTVSVPVEAGEKTPV